MMLTPKELLDSCIESKTHLTACDDDGYCVFCGQQDPYPPTEEERKRVILDAIHEVRNGYATNGDDEGYEFCTDLIDRLIGWCGPHAKIEWPYKGKTETVPVEDIVDYRSEDGHHIQLVRGYKTHHAMMMPEYISIMDPVSKDVFTYNREPKNK